MKHLLTAVLLCIASFASAQIINFPDTAFKHALVAYINPVIDTNGDGEIQVSEALAVTSLNVGFYSTHIDPFYYYYITDLTGIREFVNLQSLECTEQHLAKLDVHDMTNLLGINVGYNEGPRLDSIFVAGCTNLEGLNFGHSFTRYLDFGSINKLTGVDASFSALQTLDFTACDSLAYLNLDNSYIQTLKISGLTKIVNLGNFGFGSIVYLFAANCTGLKTLRSDYGGIGTIIDVSGCVNLESVRLGENGFTTLDLSSCIHLHDLRIDVDNPGLQYLNIKNGSFATINLEGASFNAPLINICADDFEVDTVTHMILDWGYNGPFNISPYCSFFPGGNYNTIKGKIRLDLNNNGCDNGDPGMPNVPIRITDGTGNSIVRYTAPSGDYAHYPYAGTFTLTPYFPYPYFNISPTSSTIVFNTANSLLDSAHFCIQPNGTHNDLEVTLIPGWAAARPGDYPSYRLVYKNKGTSILSGTVQLNFDNARMSFGNSTIPVSNQTTGQLTWNYSNLLPFQSRTIDMYFYLFTPPVNNIGDTLHFLATIDPVAGDDTPADNSFVLLQGVIGPWDPNSKECLEGSKIALTDIDDYLHYVIHFQNLGTDTAFNVVLADTLSNNYDWDSFEFINASHTCDVKRDKNKLEFYFRDIDLPYQAINDPGSNGFVAFKVKPKTTVVPGDSLNNKAFIYFDFNLPVGTNMATTIINPGGVVALKLEYFSLTTKNENNLLTWKVSSNSSSTNFGIERSNDGIHFSKFGNITATAGRCQLPFNFTDENPFDGKTYYRLNIKDADGNSYYSKVLVAGRTKSGLSVNAVVSDKNNTVIYLDASKAQNLQLKIIAADGRLMYNQNKTIEAGNSTVNLQLKNLATGIYTLIIYTSEGEVITKRFIK